MQKIKLCAIAFSVILAMTNFSSYAQNSETGDDAINHVAVQEIDTLGVVLSTMPYSLNPHLGTYHTEAQIQSALYEGLFVYGPDANEPQNAIATSYKISRDKLRWTFTIRENAKWSDGTQITANDVRQSWLNLLSNPNAAYSSLLDVIAGAKEYRTGIGEREDVAIFASNDSTLTIRLTEPTGHLPHILCHNSMSVVQEDLSIYSGAFVLESLTADNIVLAKNENYWDAENVKLNKINVTRTDESTDATYLYNTGAADWIVENADVATVLNKSAVQVSAEFATLYLYFKSTGKNTDNTLFRTALLEAVPWNEIRSGFIIPATTLVYPLAGYPEVDGYSYTDADEAASLMKEARKAMGISEDEKISLTFAIGENTEYMRNIAQALNAAWKPLGVEVTPLTVRGDYFGSLGSINADILMYNWIGDFGDPMAFLELFRGDSTLNVTGWKNEEFDALLSQSAYATGIERSKLLSAAEQVLIDDAEIIPISHMVSLNVIDTNSVGGWVSNALNVHQFKFMFKRKNTKKLEGVI